MSSNHYLENLDSRYVVKSEATSLLYPRSAELFSGLQAVQLSTAANTTTNSSPAVVAAPAHTTTTNNNNNNHHLHQQQLQSLPVAAHQQQQHHHHHLHHHHSNGGHQQHLSHHHQPHNSHHGYVTFTTQILDAVNLTPVSPSSVYHSPNSVNDGGNSSLLSLDGVMITAKEEPIELPNNSMSPTTVVSATRTVLPVTTAKRRRPTKPANKQFACDKCEFRTAARGNLNLHENSVHLKIKHPCDQCKYEATQVSSLNLHKRAIHQKIKFPCDQCEYQASTRGNLKIHKDAKHLKIRYPCGHCDYRATQMSSLRKHFKSKHGEILGIVNGVSYL